MKDIDEYYSDIRENFREIQEEIEKAAARAGVSPETIRIVAVTKSHPVEKIDAGIRAGLRLIGENKVQEAEQKLPLLTEEYEEFHYIGHLQKNKINKLLRLQPSLIHSIDKYSTAESLSKSLERENLRQKILIQVNTSGEESKFGVDADYPSLRALVHKISLLERLEIKGLMTISKLTDDKEAIRDCFALLRRYFDDLRGESIPGVKMEILSMGMTDDYQIAIEEGANMLRIGTALFGKRSTSQKQGEI